MKSPQTSGLSLLIHLTIIAFATVLGYLFGRHSREFAYVNRLAHAVPARVIMWYKRSLSLAIVVSLTMLMVTFTSIAIQTGIREGLREPQIKYVVSHVAQWATGVNIEIGIWDTLLSKHLYFQRNDTDARDAYEEQFVTPLISNNNF